ncbi:MAG: PilZ domain-containing protein [Candidatus Omnitrophota bacterium]
MYMQEQRQFQRIDVAVEAKCKAMGDAPGPYKNIEIVDIHHQGCRLVGSVDFSRGEEVCLLADFPQEGQLQFQAVAAWSKPIYKNTLFETGMRFLTDDRLSEETYLKLYHFCLINQSKV